MFYAIPDILLTVSLNTNKTGHHFLHGDQFYWCLMPLSTIFQLYRGGQFYTFGVNRQKERFEDITAGD
jgi:hypothetical protein